MALNKYEKIARPRAAMILVGAAAAALAGWRAGDVRGENAEPPVLLDHMDGARPAFRLLAAPPGVRLVRQAIENGHGDFGTAERIELAVPAGVSAPLAYGLPPAPVIDDLRLDVWAWCNRAGMQLAATVVLPRSSDEQTKRPRELVVRSGVAASGGKWERMTLTNLRVELERQARVARVRFGPDVDTRGAYVNQLVILAPGGTEATELWVDRIEVHGPLRPGRAAVAGASSEIDLAAAWNAAGANAASSSSAAPRGKPPAVPRIIQWQGEPWELMRKLGFDAVWMGRLPNEMELAEANRLGLWLICPPPSVVALRAHGLGDDYAGVLAWDLGELAAESDVAAAEDWARELKRVETMPDRPTVLRSRGMPRQASRIAGVTVLGRPTVGATASWSDYAAWITMQRRLAQSGATLWVAVDTHVSDQQRSQLAALRGGTPPAGAASYRHLSQATTATLGAWPRGFLFESRASLAGTDAETRSRALALELTNLRLGMVEPWLDGGRAATAAQSSQPDLTAMVLTVERSHLVVPMRWGPSSVRETHQAGGAGVGASHAPYGVGTSWQNRELKLLVPGAPESCDAYLLSVAGPQQVTTRRVTGGLSVTLEDLPDDSFLLLTEDAYAFSHVQRYLRQYAPRAARARVELAALGRQQAEGARARLSPAVLQSVGAEDELARVDASLNMVQQNLRGQNDAAAFTRAAEAEQRLDQLKERLFAAVWRDGRPGSSPLAASWSTFGDLARVAVTAAGSNAAPTLLPAGDFENLEALLAQGWRRSESTQSGVEGAVRLSPDGPHDGRFCLELEARLSPTSQSPAAFASPPVWITSPPLSVPAGHLVEITGWVRVPERPIGSADPALIFDSIGGEESALRIESGSSWTPFRLVRAAPPGATCRVTVALGGVGRAAVDSLQYRVIPWPAAAGRVANRR
jgi:hypothetical protein